MNATFDGYRRILVAMDFSAFANAAFQQAVWVARRTGAKIMLVNTLRDLRKAVHCTSAQARMDLLYGEGSLFQREIRRDSDAKMREMIRQANVADLDVQCETILGEAFVGIIHAVQQEEYDLVLAGTRGHRAWQQMLLGSTSRRLIRKCPADVWITSSELVGSPQIVLALTDFSDVSRKAVLHGLWIARQAKAAFHVLHVIDNDDVPADLFSKGRGGSSWREQINQEAQQNLEHFNASLGSEVGEVHAHLSWGTPWKEIVHTAKHIGADLVTLGTVGRSGIEGLLLGNTAEHVLTHCDCSILTVKPDGFVSPIQPATWFLHP